MSSITPPPLPRSQRTGLNKASKLIIGLALLQAGFIGLLIALRLLGLLRPFSVPTSTMKPAVSAGDHVVVENFSFLFREPRRGDVVVFKSDGIAMLPPQTCYVKRITGEPNDHVCISEDKLFINEKQVSLSNAVGEISYVLPQGQNAFLLHTNVTVPKGCYYVLGDNSTNSLDSRHYGIVSRGNIIGRVSFCYWPPGRIGKVK
ncbi:MAG TPA: signal peptidase I [Clostridia bacterium]|nr:signal peptidase I [Clostridia bacterium]